MKKWISCLLAAAVIFATMGAHAVTVSAETTAITDDQRVEMKTNASSLNKGDTVDVSFYIHGGAVSRFEGHLEYDPALDILGVTYEKYTYPAEESATGVLIGEWEHNEPKLENNDLKVWSDHGPGTPVSDKLVLTIHFKLSKSVANVNIGLTRVWMDGSSSSDIGLMIENKNAKNFSLKTADKTSGFDAITVPVKFTSKDSFSSLKVSADFDTTKLVFDSVTISPDFKKTVSVTYSVDPQSGAKATVEFNITEGINGSDKTLGFLNFHALPSAGGTGTGTGSTPAETITRVKIAAKDVKNKDENVFLLNDGEATCEVTITRKSQSTGSTERTKLVILGTESVSGYDMITVPVNLMVNEGFSSLGISATFDPAKLIYDSVVISDVYKNNVQLDSYTMSQTGSKLTVNLTSKGDIKTTGTLMYLNFRVSNLPATSGTGTQASATKLGPTPVVLNVETVDKLTPTELQYVATTTSVVTITEREHLAGDVNGNNRIDLIDVLYVIQYYNDVKKLTDVEFRAADMDKNGVVNLIDARIMLQYYDSEL